MRGAHQIRLVSAIVIASWLQAAARGADQPEPPASRPATASTTRVLVLPFESLSGDPTGDVAAVAGLARSLADDLSAAPSVTCSRGDKVAADAAGAKELGEADGAQFVVWGTTQVIADRVRVAAQVLDVGSGTAVARFKLTGTTDGWFELQDAVAERVRRRVEIRSRRQQEHALEGAPAPDVPGDTLRPVELPGGEPLRLPRRMRGSRAAWAEPPERPREELAHRYGAAVPYDFVAYGYGGYTWTSRHFYRPHRPWRSRFGRYTYDGGPYRARGYYGARGLSRFYGPVPLQWYYRH